MSDWEVTGSLESDCDCDCTCDCDGEAVIETILCSSEATLLLLPLPLLLPKMRFDLDFVEKRLVAVDVEPRLDLVPCVLSRDF